MCCFAHHRGIALSGPKPTPPKHYSVWVALCCRTKNKAASVGGLFRLRTQRWCRIRCPNSRRECQRTAPARGYMLRPPFPSDAKVRPRHPAVHSQVTPVAFVPSTLSLFVGTDCRLPYGHSAGCPFRVRLGHRDLAAGCPFHSQEQTSSDHCVECALCQQRTSCWSAPLEPDRLKLVI
jgi:hypothetical protein